MVWPIQLISIKGYKFPDSKYILYNLIVGKVIDAMDEKCDSLMSNYTEHLYGKYNRQNKDPFKFSKLLISL